MRLHRLELQAFGPFRDRQVVDFDNLSAAGLFLLHGSTGAGKSSVLDAVCFALFGRVPGPRSTVTSLRSHYADATVAPEVVLEFSVGPRRLSVHRSPSWERPKKRGDGTTTTQARVIVREWDGELWQPRATRLDEAGHLLQDVLGMGPEEFTKLVLLPQGEFAAFLRADAETRRALLEKIFGTDRYTSVQDWIREARARARADLDAVDRRTATLLAQAEQAASVALRSPGERGHPNAAQQPPVRAGGQATVQDTVQATAQAPGVLALARVEQVLAALGPLHEQAVSDHLGTAAEAERSEVRLAQAQAMSQLAAQFATLVDRQQAVEERGPEIERARSRLDAARRAAPLSALVSSLAQARTASEQARRHLQRLMADPELAATGGPEDAAQDAARGEAAELEAIALESVELGTRWARARDACTTELAELTALVPVLAERDRVTETIAATERVRDHALVELEQSTTELTRAEAEAVAAEASCATAALATASVDADRAALDRARGRALAVQDRDRLAVELEALRTRLAEARDAALTAREHSVEVRERRLDALASELASTLEDGRPCRVCGATEHPAPAPADPGGASAQDEAEARSCADRATELVTELTARQAGLLAALDARTAAAEGLDAAAAASDLDAARHQLALSTQATGELAQRREQAQQSRHQAMAARERRDLAGARAQDAEQRLAVLRAQLAALTGRILERSGEDPGDADAIAAALERATRHRELLDQAIGAQVRLRDADHHLRAVRRAAAATAEQGGFPGLDAAIAAVLDEGATAVLERAVIEHTVELESVEEQLTDERFTVLHDGDSGVPDADAMRALTLYCEQTTVREQEAFRRAALCENAVAEVEQLRAALAEHLDSTAPMTAEFDALDDLARCLDGTGGDNALRMSLSAYVLAARLEQVASAASERLAQMSGGRYALVHTDAAGRGRGRTGLTLEVVDAWTGVRRPTSTLSGGEAFYTSLALALGLADVVSAESGGVHLDTLFIDEGFGSLDEDTLDEVMDTLDELRSGGRAVGIVSHLAELRQRIGVRLEVDKSERGSTLTLAC
ncbi:MAG: AAA family ATPase [Kineosporiaceae bacterium]|nr:AAA family ATPase [Kineosporiaceae bacterium]